MKLTLIRSGFAATAGAVLVLAFAPWELWLAAPLSIAALYALLQPLSARSAALAGFAFGVGYFGFGINWVYHSLRLFGGATSFFAVFLVALLVMICALFPMLTAWFWARIRRAGWSGSPTLPMRDAWLFAALWSLSELARGKVLGGFPWIIVGYSQTDGPLGAYAPVIGVYGIGFLLVGASASLVVAFCSAATFRTRASAIAGIVMVIGMSVAATSLEFTEAKSTTLGVRLVQANIPQSLKFDPDRLDRSLRDYRDLSLESLPDGIDMVVWPETAIPASFDRVLPDLAPWIDEMEARNIDVLTGGFEREGERTWNAVRQLGGAEQLYRKRHLVPFGEYLPFRGALEMFAALIEIPGSDLSRGSGPVKPMTIAGEAIGLSICYEDVFGEELRALVPESTVLVNVSNDAWFGNSAAPHQHEQKARMRARELARPLIRVTNTGVSSSISYDGVINGRIAHDVRGTLDVRVTPRTGLTWYARTGNWPVFAAAIAIIGTAILTALYRVRAGRYRQPAKSSL